MKASAEEYRLLFDLNPNPMWILDEATLKFLAVNEAAVKLYGWSRQEWLGMTINDIRPPEEVPKLAKSLAKQHGSRMVFVGEWRHWKKDHTPLDVEVTISCIQFQGRDARLTMVNDVTERKRAAETVRWSRTRAELLSRVISTLLTATDPQTVVEQMCNEVREFLHCAVFFNYLVDLENRRLRFNACGGVAPRIARLVEGLELSGSLCGTAARDNRRVLAENLTVAFDARSKLVRSLGVRAYACHPLLGPGNKAFGTLSFGATDRDVFSEADLALMQTVAGHVAFAMLRHRTEQSLRASEERLALAASGTRIGMFEWDMANGQMLGTEQCAQLLGLKRRNTTTRTTTLSLSYRYLDWTRRIYRADLPRVEAELRRCLNKHQPFEAEYRVVWPDQSVHWMAARGVFVYHARGRPERMLGIIMDVTGRKQAEMELKEFSATLEHRVAERTEELTLANERLHAVMDTALLGVLTLDEQGVIEAVNPAASQIFGYAPREILRSNVNRLMALPNQPQQENFLSHYLQNVEQQARNTRGEVLGRHKRGHAMTLEFALAEFPRAGRGQFVAMVRDITPRKRLERELLDVGERERRRLGHDLHDGLGQHLHALYYMASLLEKEMRAASSEQAHEAGRLAQQLEHALELTRSLARGLQPVNAVPEGLMLALRELAERTRVLYRVDCRFQCRNPVLIQRHTAANHLYRIAQEAVNNAMKHGKPTRIVIKLAGVGERIILGVRDNGVGIRQQTTRSTGMGLRVMQFRAEAIRGSLAVQRHPQGGTEVVCGVTRQALIPQLEEPT